MPLRYSVIKQSAQGEQISIDIPQWNPVTGEIQHSVEDVYKLVDATLQASDMRMTDMNIRMLESYNLIEMLPVADQSRLIDILDILAGRQHADTVRRRWASAIEETSALEHDRSMHANNGGE